MKNNLLISLFLLILFQNCSVNEPDSKENLFTAARRIIDIEKLASEISKGLILKSIKSENVHINGEAETWQYKYSSGGIAVDYYFTATLHEVMFDSTSKIILIGEGFINNQWFDSDEAMRIAEKNGGKEFRAANKDYKIEIFLTEPVIPNAETYWFVKYKSGNNILHLGINNSTKEVKLYY